MARFIGIDECDSVSGAAIVIDVMRAYTVAAWALHLGAARMILVKELEEALELKSRFPGSLALKDGAPAEGFRSVQFARGPSGSGYSRKDHRAADNRRNDRRRCRPPLQATDLHGLRLCIGSRPEITRPGSR